MVMILSVTGFRSGIGLNREVLIDEIATERGSNSLEGECHSEAARPEESRSFAFAQDDTTKYKVLSSKKTGAIKLLGAR